MALDLDEICRHMLVISCCSPGIQRIMTDPLLTSNKNAEKYKDILGRLPREVNISSQCLKVLGGFRWFRRTQTSRGLLRFVLREFFTCAETNKCVFAELP